MSLNISAATARLVREMNAAEDTIAGALVATAGLLHTAASASRDVTDAPVVKTQATLLHLNKMVASLIDAQVPCASPPHHCRVRRCLAAGRGA